MNVRCYYNENDTFAAAWLRNLITANVIAAGDVDERSIRDVKADDLRGYSQCHFFAGIGGWSRALRLAGWHDDRTVWTGSCPCQPFSAAGKRKGTADERHLWPEFHRLIRECSPPIVFGEQVASKDGRLWLTGVRADLEALGYAVGAADLCAAGAGEEVKGRISYEDGSFRWEPIIIGAPHIRQRLYWMADAASGGHGKYQRNARTVGGARDCNESQESEAGRSSQTAWGRGEVSGLGDAERGGFQSWRKPSGGAKTNIPARAGGEGFWSTAQWLPCTDGKARRIEPGSFPLAHGVPARMGRLRGYGNAIVPQVAAEFIGAVMGIA